MKAQKRLRIGGGTVITRDPSNPMIEGGGLVIEGTTVKAVGTDDELKAAYPDAEYLDAEGRLIMPGLINAHHHIYSAFARGMSIPGNTPQNFLEILEGTWWNIDRHLTLEATYLSAAATYMECIRNGVTTVIDHHASYGAVTGSLFRIADAARHIGVRTCLAYEISDREGAEKTEEALKESFAFLEYAQGDSDSLGSKALIGLHASFTLSDETLEKCRLKNTKNAGYHVHIAEGAYDNQHALEHYGCSAVKRLYDRGILGPNTVAGHCIHISDEDLDLLKSSGTTVVYNPESNMGNAVGSPDVLKMFDKGIFVCLGTDGYTSDMLESAKVAVLLQKHRSGNPSRGFGEAAQMLFYNNAALATQVFGRPIGVLCPGAVADVIFMDYHAYTPLNRDTIDGHLFFGVSGAHTDTVIINGKIRMKNRRIQLEDERELLEASRIESAKLWRKLYG